MSRISVIRNDRVVPLLPGKPRMASLFSPWKGMIVERHAIPSIEIPEHEHSTLCLHMQTSRPVAMEWWSEGRHGIEQTGPGALILLAPGTRDRLRWSASSERVVVSLDEAVLARAAEELGYGRPPGFRNHWVLRDRQLQLLLSEIQREMETGWRTGPLYADLMGMSLSVAILRSYVLAAEPLLPVTGGMPGSRLRRVIEYIHENSHEELRLEKLAAIAAMSVFHFARAFRKEMGISPHRYVIDQRLEQARNLMRLNTRTISEIAAETGFCDAGDFARVFRRRFGLSPTEWKRQSR